jgi:predicted regulator of Ras-like GTPase activity (Roadblock/LC7/MglB family)
VPSEYEQQLEELLAGIPGAHLATLCGLDGIGIAACRTPDSSLDPAAADAEFATVLTAAKRTSQGLGVGEIRESILATEKTVVVLQGVGTDFLIGVVLDARIGTLGLARVKVRRVAEEFAKTLAG